MHERETGPAEILHRGIGEPALRAGHRDGCAGEATLQRRTQQDDAESDQQDSGNAREALREIELDIAEGADMVMVKPAMSYLDILRETADRSPVPVAAYQISGEYSMITAAAQNGWIDRDAAILESLIGIRRAGADVVLTYWASEVAGWL